MLIHIYVDPVDLLFYTVTTSYIPVIVDEFSFVRFTFVAIRLIRYVPVAISVFPISDLLDVGYLPRLPTSFVRYCGVDPIFTPFTLHTTTVLLPVPGYTLTTIPTLCYITLRYVRLPYILKAFSHVARSCRCDYCSVDPTRPVTFTGR